MVIAGGLLMAVLVTGLRAQAPTGQTPMASKTMAGGSILPTGLGEAIDRDVAKLNAATERSKSASVASAAGYPVNERCIEHQPHGAMGYHFGNQALHDATLEVERTNAEPPSTMGQALKKADSLGIWYLHVWNVEHNPSGLFADWNPRVKC